MKAHVAFVLCCSLAAAACGKPRVSVPQDWSKKSESEQRGLLDKLADDCSLPHDTFRLAKGQLYLIPHADEQYEHVDCALEALRPIRGRPKLGFVGNEYPAGNEQ